MDDLTAIDELRRQGQHEAARQQLVELAGVRPADAAVQYAAASVHDFLGFEAAAVPYYQAAIANGLSGADLRGAYLGLGSTYRTLGQYEAARTTFNAGLVAFPDAAELKVFLAMALYNLGAHHEAMSLLLTVVADTSADADVQADVQAYERAIRFYAADLDRRWADVGPRPALAYLQKQVNLKIDRPLGSHHPENGSFYMLNYGFVPGTLAPDGDELDAYVLGVYEPIAEFEGECIAVLHRLDDDDDKLVVVPAGQTYTDAQILALTAFQERYFQTIVLREPAGG